MLDRNIAVWSHISIGIRRSGSFCSDAQIDLREAATRPREILIEQYGEEIAEWIASGAVEPLYRFDGTILHRSW